MYYVITYRSRQLKRHHNTVSVNESDGLERLEFDNIDDEEDNDVSSADKKLTRKERKQLKKQLKESELANEKIYIIDGEEVSEEDLTDYERAEIRSENLINKDSFYDALEPFDSDEVTTQKKKFNNKSVLIIGGGVLVIVGSIIYVIVEIGSL